MENITKVERLRREYMEAVKGAQDILDQYEGKDMPADKIQEVDARFDAAEIKRQELELMTKSREHNAFINAVDTQKRLVVEGGKREVEVTDEVKAFNAYLHGDMSRETRAQLRKAGIEGKAALNEGTDSQGGYLTPNLYANEIVIPLFNKSYLRLAGSRQINMTSDSLEWPKLTATTAAVLTAEAASYDEQEPTLGATVFKPYKYTRIVKASEEVIADSRFDVWGQIIQPDIIQAFAAAENAAFTTGTGSSQPEGLLQNAPVGVTLATGHTTALNTADDVVNLYFSLDYKYRPGAKFMMSDTVLKQARELKDQQSRYLLADNINNLTEAPQMTILGSPVVINNSFPTPAASKILIVFGDFSYFYIADREGLSVKYLQELYAASGQVAWAVNKRFDSHMMLTAAFSALESSAT